MINAISDPDEIDGIRGELVKLEKHFQDILKYQVQLDNSGDNFEKDDIAWSHLPEEFNGDITIPRKIMADMGNIHKEITIPNRIFLKGFESSTSEEDLEDIFKKYGSIIETKIIRDPISGQNKGFGFITFDSQQVAENVIATCKSVELDGTEITVGAAKIRRRPPTKYFRQSYFNNSANQTPPRFLSVPYSVSPDGLFIFHQQAYAPPQIASVYFPGDPAIQMEGETFTTTNTLADSYLTNPDQCVVTSKPGKPVLPVMENYGRFEPTEFPPKKMAPVNTSNGDYRPVNYNHADANHMNPNRKNVPFNAYIASTHLPIINNQFVNVNGPCMNSADMKSGLATTDSHLPNINGHIQNPYENLPLNGNLDVTFLNGNMANLMIPNHCVPVATLMTPEMNGVETNHYGNPEVRKSHLVETPALPTRSVPSRVSNKVNSTKVNGDPNCQNLKSQKYVFMSTGPGKVKRVIVH